jgi:hypothetical protein
VPLLNAGKNIMLDALAGQALFASLHTADPGTSGANEVSGGGYARQSITWFAASAGNLDNNANPTFSVPAGTVSWFGLWTASSGGTLLATGDLTDETFVLAGTYTLTDVDVTLP